MKPKRLPICIVDYEECLRIPKEDKRLARPTKAYFCEWCKREGSYNGKLVFATEPSPFCAEKHELISAAISGVPQMIPVMVKLS